MPELCTKCSSPLPEGAKFCPQCGKKLVQRQQNKKARGNGTGSVYKRGKTWCAAISTIKNVNGTYNRKVKGGFKTKKEAVLYLDELRFRPKKEKKISALYDALTPHIEKLSDSKQTHYKTAYNRLSKIHSVNIGDLSVADLQTVIDDAVSTFYPAKDMRDLLSLLYQHAIKEEYVTVNKARYVILPDLDEKGTLPFTADEIKALWADYQNGQKETGFFLLMIYTGMMPGEARRVTASMIQLSEKRIIGAGLKTAKRKETPIILPDIIVPVVQDLMEGKAPDDRLWETDENTFYEYFTAMKSRTGCRQITELRPYSCRHTTATTLADANVSAAIIQDVMRHAKISTTQRYMHISQESSLKALNKVFDK